jgi:O-antigen ligase/tetratricopeptide (TPR) repeat protein
MDVTEDSMAVPQARGRLGIVAGVSLATLGYVIFIGGTGRGELDSVIGLVNGAIAGLFILLYVLRGPREADRIDHGILLALLLFAGAAVLSLFPRQSFDAALGALTATAGLFVLRGELADAEARRWFVRLFAGLTVAIAFITAAKWFPLVIQWWSGTGWTVVPPLDLNFSAAPWGHRHDLALLVVLLYPSLWIGQRTPLRAAATVIFGVIVLGIVVIDGSRNLWLAMLGSTAAVLVPIGYRRLRGNRRGQRLVLVAAVVALGLVIASGLAAAIVDRLANVESLGGRGAMWGPLLQAFSERPIGGYGPGSFAWVLPLTDYYDTNTWAPRHPDSAFFQLLAEGGILGLASAAVVLGSLSVPVFRGRSTAATWALITFVLASVGANPTDFPFLVAVAIGWTAYALPRDKSMPADNVAPLRGMRFALLGALAIIAVAFAATTAAGIFYQGARRAAEDTDLSQARQLLNVAIALDPGMALYPRQRGTLDYLSGNPGGSLADLELATRLNPSDDLAWRTLALARSAAGQDEASDDALRRAIANQRSDAANLLLQARQQSDRGDQAGALATLGEVVQAWPETVSSPGWASFLPESVTSADVIDEALRRWQEGLAPLEPLGSQGLWLTTFAGRSDLDQNAIDGSGLSAPLGQAMLKVLHCDSGSAEALDRLTDSDRRTQLFWELRMMQSATEGEPNPVAWRLLQIMKGYSILRETADDTLRPVIETGFNADIWGYRRQQILWRTNLDELPSPDAGAIRWLFDPRGAAQAAGLTERLPACY